MKYIGLLLLFIVKNVVKTVVSTLDDIKGIGQKTKQLLLVNLKSVKRIKESTLEELIPIIGKTKS